MPLHATRPGPTLSGGLCGGEGPTHPGQSYGCQSLLYCLNHKSHRIQAQLRSLGEAGKIIEEDPYSEEAQSKIADIIRHTKGYETVKATIRRDQQQDPGMITHEGVLVNANTRAVVLRELCAELGHDEAKQFEYIKIQILPADATEPEIVRLELSYQMRPNVQQVYTFTNQLLFIRDLLAAGWTPEDIGLEMYRSYNPDIPRDRMAAAKDIETEDHLRQMIEELIASSGGALTWTDFDTERQNLVDIDSSYQTLAARRGSRHRAPREASQACGCPRWP